MYRVCFCLVLLAAPAAQALTLFATGGYRFGSTMSAAGAQAVEREDGAAAGVVVHAPYDADSGLELLVSSGRAPMDEAAGAPRMQVTHLMLGGVQFIEDGAARPFLGVGVGMSQLLLDSSDVWRPSWALYGGVHWPLADALTLRAEVRWTGIHMSSPTTLQCDSGCSVRIDEGVWTEIEAMFGFGVSF